MAKESINSFILLVYHNHVIIFPDLSLNLIEGHFMQTLLAD